MFIRGNTSEIPKATPVHHSATANLADTKYSVPQHRSRRPLFSLPSWSAAVSYIPDSPDAQ